MYIKYLTWNCCSNIKIITFTTCLFVPHAYGEGVRKNTISEGQCLVGRRRCDQRRAGGSAVSLDVYSLENIEYLIIQVFHECLRRCFSGL